MFILVVQIVPWIVWVLLVNPQNLSHLLPRMTLFWLITNYAERRQVPSVGLLVIAPSTCVDISSPVSIFILPDLSVSTSKPAL